MRVSDGTLALGSITFTKISIQTRVEKTAPTTLDLRTDILYNESVIPVQLSGTIRNQFLGSLSCNFDIKAKSLPLDHIPTSQGFSFSGGTADFTGMLSSNEENFHLDGTFKINNLDMTVGWISEDTTTHQDKKYRIAQLFLQIQGDLQGQKISFSTLNLRSDTFHLLGSLTLDLNNINNPSMDLRLKTDEMALSTLKMLLPDQLINNWIIQTLLPRLENGTGRITNLVLTGTMEEIGRLEEAEYAHCLSWSGILKNVDSFYNDHNFLARIHTALLSMDGDVLTIKEVKGESGKSILNHGNMAIRKLYDPISILTTDIQGSFSLSWLEKLIKAGLSGEDMQQLMGSISMISGKINGSFGLCVGLEKHLKLKTLNGKGTAKLLEIAFTDVPFPVKIKKAGFSLSYPGTCSITGKGSCGKTTFDGSLNLLDFNKKQEANLQIMADISELKKILPDNPTLHSFVPCISHLPLRAVFTMQNNTLSSSGSFDFSHFTTFDNSLCKQRLAENKLLQLNYALEFEKNKLTVKNLVLLTKTGKFEIKCLVQTDSKNPLNVKKMSLQAENFPVQAFVLLIPKQDDILNGTLDAELKSTDFFLKNNMWQSINGNLRISDWQGSLGEWIRVNTVDLTLTMNNENIILIGNNIHLADFNPETPFDLQVNILKNDVLSGTIIIYGKSLNISKFSGMLTTNKTKVYFPLSIGRIDVFAGFDQVCFRNLNFSPLLMEGLLLRDRFIISRYLLQQDDSFIWLTGHRQDDAVMYQSFFKIIEKPLDSWMEIFGFGNDVITGSLNLQGKLTSRVTSGSTIFENATGPLYVEIKKGTLKSSSTLTKLLNSISLKNIFDSSSRSYLKPSNSNVC